jgi:ferric-dicitrate binding protein FerR (iron transport regulator)
MDNPNDILLSKWLQKTISDAELELLSQEYDLDSLQEVLKRQESLEFDLAPTDDLWSTLEEKLTDKEVKPERIKTSSRGFKSLLPLIVLLALLLSALVYYFMRPAPGEININTKPAQQVQQIIANNTTVDLAPGSSIVYNEDTWQESRVVNLRGQAFFDVSKGDKFSVNTSLGVVEVLGTEFEVWERDEILTVSCYEGQVKVTNANGQSMEIGAGEKVIVNNGQIGQIEKHDTQRPGFLTGRVSYDKIEFSSLVKEIERFYNVAVNTNDVEMTKSFSGILISNDIEKGCSYIAETLDLNYEMGTEKIEFYSN